MGQPPNPPNSHLLTFAVRRGSAREMAKLQNKGFGFAIPVGLESRERLTGEAPNNKVTGNDVPAAQEPRLRNSEAVHDMVRDSRSLASSAA